MDTAQIRRRFLDFFARNDHAVVPSASLLYNDPTLLFVNAGMVPFKAYFTEVEPSPYKRAVSVQKCVRTLDIDEVGKTTRHGTFFQMAGNFSFGDYFKQGAINYAWELVTGSQSDGNYGFAPDKIWVTVLGPGVHPDYPDGDAEARDLWLKVGVAPDHIQYRGLKDNYWNMGVPGPGGPCSEIYIDRGPQYGPDGGPEADEDRFLEIWNLVFQTEDLSVVRAKDDFDVRSLLPSKNIDTGLGLERTAFLLQGVDNMYEIDQVFPVIERASQLSGRRYGVDHDDDVRLRVVADHVRSGLMLMTDGVTPGNEARGYVLRRLLRRSIRSMRLLGVTSPNLIELLSVSRAQMESSYPEIAEQWPRIEAVAAAEEDSFGRTLSSGTQLFDMAVTQTRHNHATVLPGDKAFQLHDTYGFPIDLTLEMAAEAGISVDLTGFTALMAEQKARAKADAKAKKGGATATSAYADLRKEGESRFLGYDMLTSPARILGLIKAGQQVDQAMVGDQVEIVLNDTPFYAEAGGQDADTGVITAAGLSIDVIDVQKPIPGLIVHRGVITDGQAEIGAEVTAAVDAPARFGACQAHTATHVVNAALRQLLGPQTHQAGSYNKPGYLRFDFNALAGMSEDMKQEMEGVANEAIRADWEVTATQMPLDSAKALGAQAMFGEKYGDIVRMVEFAGPWSRELCGGTHVASTGRIGLLSLLSEGSVGSGVRRVEALVSTDAFGHLAAERAIVAALSSSLKVQPGQLEDRIGKLLAQLKQAEKTISELKAAQAGSMAVNLINQATQVGQIRFVSAIDAVASGDVRGLAIQLRDRLGVTPAVVCLISTTPKPSVVVATTSAARDLGHRAGDLVARAAAALGGRGGGSADLAQGGGVDPGAGAAAISAVADALV
ncbi:MAG: alanine--tRNA ligase [Propionibacteriaceae bacterium]|jgi:alanyl-tRNA synthetase|nr:alanine--tRNA ligase [Propionibacteriaceae bacterium]